MNKDIFEGKWKQIRGEAKAWWGKLTDDDLDRANGKFDVLAGLLQEKYGYTRQRAADEIDKRVTEYEAGLKKKTKPVAIQGLTFEEMIKQVQSRPPRVQTLEEQKETARLIAELNGINKSIGASPLMCFHIPMKPKEEK